MTRTPTSPTSRLDDRPTATRLLQVAADLFAERGYAKTSMQDVADAVGILKGSLYYYIDSKEDLLFRILDDTRIDTIEFVEEISARTDLPPLERLRAYVERHIEYNATNVTKITVYYHELASLSPARRRQVDSQNKRYEKFVEQLIDETKEAGDVDPGLDTKLLTKGVFATINHLYRWYRPDGRVKPRDAAVQFAEFVVAGVVGSRPRPAE